jgi:hypothetical protein
MTAQIITAAMRAALADAFAEAEASTPAYLKGASGALVSKRPLPLPVNSSAIRSAEYAPETGDFTITFKGSNKVYTHHNVPIPVVLEFVAAASQGAFYDAHIKGRY